MNRSTVVKIGGSLVRTGEAARLMRSLADHRGLQLAIVPGGGAFADAVRDAQARHGFSDRTAHHLALLAMEMTGRMLADGLAACVVAARAEDFADAWQRGRIAVWAPSCMAASAADVPASWDATSDTLSAWLARHLDAARLVVVKSCDVSDALQRDAHALAAAGVVDPCFPSQVADGSFDWTVVTGVDAALAALRARPRG
jgi:dihydroneopterin aldolase